MKLVHLNVIHSHKEDAWSGIYYVQSEGTGNLVFHKSSKYYYQHCNTKSPFTRKTGIQPKDGMLVLWARLGAT